MANPLTPFLVVDRDTGVWQAMETSRKLVTRHWFKVFFLGIVVILVLIGSGFLIGIPYIWTLPWAVLCLAVVYRNLGGVRTA